jgi:hypothetical protein
MARLSASFQSAEKFKARYATLGFSDQAKLDEGAMWAAGFAITKVTTEVEARIGALVKQAVSRGGCGAEPASFPDGQWDGWDEILRKLGDQGRNFSLSSSKINPSARGASSISAHNPYLKVGFSGR